jgi:hypothetical protein
MTEKYFISTNSRITGSHTVHRQGCPFLPEPGRRIPLGVFQSSQGAVKEGRSYFRSAESCPFCSKEHNVIKRSAFPVRTVNPGLILSARMRKASWMDLMFYALS